MARVELSTPAKEDLQELDRSVQILALKAIRKLEDCPEKRGEPLGSRHSGDLTGFRKLAFGNRQYRIVYRVEADGTVCVIWVVGSRVDGRCYDLAVARLKLFGSDPRAPQLQQILDAAWDTGRR